MGATPPTTADPGLLPPPHPVAKAQTLKTAINKVALETNTSFILLGSEGLWGAPCGCETGGKLDTNLWDRSGEGLGRIFFGSS